MKSVKTLGRVLAMLFKEYWFLLLIVGITVAGILLMWFLPSVLPVLLVGAFLFGIVYAMTTVQTPLLVRSVFGSADYTNIYSRVSMVGTLMSAVAAVFWSFVIDSPLGFPGMFVGGLICMAICAATALYALGQRDKVLSQP